MTGLLVFVVCRCGDPWRRFAEKAIDRRPVSVRLREMPAHPESLLRELDPAEETAFAEILGASLEVDE